MVSDCSLRSALAPQQHFFGILFLNCSQHGLACFEMEIGLACFEIGVDCFEIACLEIGVDSASLGYLYEDKG